jgi:hypothetical protein
MHARWVVISWGVGVGLHTHTRTRMQHHTSADACRPSLQPCAQLAAVRAQLAQPHTSHPIPAHMYTSRPSTRCCDAPTLSTPASLMAWSNAGSPTAARARSPPARQGAGCGCWALAMGRGTPCTVLPPLEQCHLRCPIHLSIYLR